jgi:hypothetical protein
MSSIERDLNHYLFLEFSLDLEEDESRVSDSWPFELRKIAELEDGPLFEFDDKEPFFAFGGNCLSFLPKAGMDIAALVQQLKGALWISSRNPVNLEMSTLGDPSVPSGLERRRALEVLGQEVLPGRSVEIIEGLFLRTEQKYLGLFRAAGESEAIVGGLSRQIVVPFPEASGWRRLAWGVGQWLKDEAAVSEAD